LPPTIRRKVSGAIRRQDVEWLVAFERDQPPIHGFGLGGLALG
jgi:hypothetical protein